MYNIVYLLALISALCLVLLVLKALDMLLIKHVKPYKKIMDKLVS